MGESVELLDIDEELLNQIKNLPLDQIGQPAIKLDPNSKIAQELLNLTKHI